MAHKIQTLFSSLSIPFRPFQAFSPLLSLPLLGSPRFHPSLLTLTLTLSLGLSLFGGLACTKKLDDKDNSLYMYVNSNIKGLDPLSINDTNSNRIASHIFEPLFEYHYLKRPLELKPLVADGMPKVSNKGLTHTIKIKKGVKFHNSEVFPQGQGRELKIQDFVYQWKRIADKSNKSENFWLLDGKIKGLDQWREDLASGKATYDTPISGLQVIDDYTLKIHLARPYYQLHNILAMTPTAAVPKEAIEKWGKEFLNHPVGTGPYVFESWIRNSKVKLKKNPHWRKVLYPREGAPGDQAKGLLADAGKPLPFADQIIVSVINEDQPRWLNFLKGNLDVAEIPKDNFDSAVAGTKMTPELQAKGVRLDIFEEPDLAYIAFNMEDSFLKKHPKLRQAMSLAYNADIAIEKFYNNRAVKAHSPLPPTLEGYDKNFTNPYRRFNVKKAKALLAQAGFPGGKGLPSFEFSATNSTTARQMANYFKQQMAQINVPIRIATHSWPQFTQRIRERKAQIWGVAWLADYPDAENFLQLLYGKNASPGPNGANFNDSRYNALYEKASKMRPGPARLKLYLQMRDIMVEKTPWIPTVHRLGYHVYYDWVKNYKRHRIISNFMKYLRVDPGQRAKTKASL